MKKILALVCVAILFAGCGGAAAGPTKVTEEDKGKTFEATVGQKFEVTLKANETTPVHWTDPKIEGDAIIGTVSSEYKTEENPEGMVGVGGWRIYTFEVTSAGTAKMVWESKHIAEEGPPYDTFEITINAK
ncbi:MAG: protease inhibitor I42 family protein [Caldisericales bacterium]|jgi:predicted secreted protein|nr:protease inhibitor I42 family protein [Caldisericia bacterium]MCE5176100.1 protease inhibitor I42 family protein [bacterium]NMD14827.1 protease inhibitor I42 family protein [Caldisericales bacterium]